MKVLDRWLKPQTHTVVNSNELRELLLQAYASRDENQFVHLCRTQQAAIIANFADWQRIPEGVRENPNQLQRYGEGIIAIARYFQEELDHPELMSRLTGHDGNNPLQQWERVLRYTQQLEEQLHYHDAAKQLEELVLEIKRASCPEANQYLAIAQGAPRQDRSPISMTSAASRFFFCVPTTLLPQHSQAPSKLAGRHFCKPNNCNFDSRGISRSRWKLFAVALKQCLKPRIVSK